MNSPCGGGCCPACWPGWGRDRLVRALTVLGRAALTDARAGQLLRGALETGFAAPGRSRARGRGRDEPGYRGHDQRRAERRAGTAARAGTDRLLRFPDQTVALAGLGAEVLQRLADGSAPGSGERAGWLNDLSNRLSDLGRREEALAAIEEAVTAYRELARDPPRRLPPRPRHVAEQPVEPACRAWGGGKRPWPRSRKPSPSAASWPAPAPTPSSPTSPCR